MAVRLRREHRRCYREFLANLRRDIRTARRLQGLAMASAGEWDVWLLFGNVVLSECFAALSGMVRMEALGRD